MDNLFDLPPLPWGGDIDEMLDACSTREITEHIKEYGRAAQSDLIGRLAQMQEHEAIEWLLKARQDWWES